MISWLIQTLAAHPDLASGNLPVGLLSAPEIAQVSALKILKRRQEWLLGRLTAKELAWAYLESAGGAVRPFPLCSTHKPDAQPILPATHPELDHLVIGSDRNGAPFVAWTPRPGEPGSGERWPVSLSISHSGGRAFCALLPHDTTRLEPVTLGADVEKVAAHPPPFVRDYFTPREVAQVDQTPEHLHPALVSLIWSAKEAVLKALHCGLRADTRSLTCLPTTFSALSNTWASLEICWEAGYEKYGARNLFGWWRIDEGYLYTLAVNC